MSNPYALFKLDGEYSELIQSIEESGGEITPEQEAELDRLTALQVCKADRYKMALDMMDYGEQQCDEWINKFRAKKAAIGRERDRWQRAMLEHMDSLGIDLIEGELSKTRIMESESVAADVTKIPEQYRRTKITVEPDKTALKKALKAGEEIDGATLQVLRYVRVW